MKRKKAISVIALILIGLMLLSLVASAIAYADELDELAALRARKEELSAQVTEIQARITGLQEEQANVLEQKVALEEKHRLAEEQLALIDEEIRKYEELIQNKSLEVEAARKREQTQLEKYRTRVRAMEENGGYNILALILESGTFSQLLTAIDDMGEIMQGDRQLQEAYEQARAETEEIVAQYESEKALYEDRQTELRDEQTVIANGMEQADALLAELEEEIASAVQRYKETQEAEEAAAATISNVIASYNARKAAERASVQAESQTAAAQAAAQVQEMLLANMDAMAAGEMPVYSEQEIQQVVQEAAQAADTGDSPLGGGSIGGGGGYTWPLPCSTRVTSRFGNRTDPFTGETRYHSGIDIDGYGNDGAPVVAAAAGEVITAQYDGSYGNYIIIDHGGTSTVYAHMSGLAVSVGATVAQGQTIGYVGATGRATGTHLHFEVYVGDSRVDPAQYFSGISYYNC